MSERAGLRGDLSPWGKVGGVRPVRPYPLLFHLLDTAVVALELWDRFLASNQREVIADGLGVGQGDARSLVGFWAGLHDIGKLTPGFQRCVPQAYAEVDRLLRDDVGVVEGVRHDRASMHCSLGLLADLGYRVDAARDAGVRVAQILGGHHGRFQPVDLHRVTAAGGAGVDDGLGGGEWKRLRRQYVEAVHEVLGEPGPPERMTAPAAVLVTGVVILADWLVSQEHYWQPLAAASAVGSGKHFARAGVAAPALVAEAGLVRVVPKRRDFGQVYGIERPNPLQASVMEELAPAPGAGGLLVVTAATGDGKTETGLEAERILAAAAGTSGLCFVLPTMATSNEMYTRVARVVAAQGAEGGGSGAAVTLTHSMAWLSEAYADAELTSGARVVTDEEPSAGAGAGWAGVLPGRWLRGAKRPLLAQYAVGTIDQSLLAVLPVKHSALRMLALSGKTFVVDEAHAYDPYMQVLLGRLLQWLGAYRCPVVLLSATLPASVGERLVRAYLVGAGHGSRKVGRLAFRAPYPGWLYVDGATAACRPISGPRHEEQARERAYRLQVDVRPVRHPAPGGEGRPPVGDARLAVLEEVLRPLAQEGGSAAVVCTTVADAQETYTHLRGCFGLRAGVEIVLLHARFPGDEREAATRRIVGALGRSGRLPADRLIVVSTQVIEQSLDLDADLVVSDLAPVAQLLQRAGRCWRHEQAWSRSGKAPRERPGWAGGPRLVVLDPLGEEGEPPRHWGRVYPPYLLSATSDLLRALPREDGLHGPVAGIEVPGQVQELVETVHGAESRFEAETQRLEKQLAELQADTMAQEHLGDSAAVPGPWQVGGLQALHRETVDEVAAATRLGAESVRVLGCYRHPGGRLTLDAAGRVELPVGAGGRLSAAEVRAVMGRTFPVRAGLLKKSGPEQEPPVSWREHAFLGELVLLVHPVDAAGQVSGVQVGEEHFRLDEELGLVHTRI